MVPRSQNVRYQCANVGFLALKLPSHSGIIHAHCLSLSNYHPPSVSRRCFPTRRVPYRRHPLTRWLPPHLHAVLSVPPVPRSGPLLVPLATSLITTTTTATTSYRPGHLLENNIHKVEPRRYDRLLLLPPSLPSSFSPSLLLSLARSLFTLALLPSAGTGSVGRFFSSAEPTERDDVVHLHLRSWFRGCRDHASLQRNTYRRCTAKGRTRRTRRKIFHFLPL